LRKNIKIVADTAKQFDQVIELCSEIFLKKMEDYGTAWRIMRPTSITDQIFIKANRIRSIESDVTDILNAVKHNGNSSWS
jgi:hypothetical protein